MARLLTIVLPLVLNTNSIWIALFLDVFKVGLASVNTWNKNKQLFTIMYIAIGQIFRSADN